MKSFRLKIFASCCLLLIFFIIGMPPIITKSVQKTVVESMKERADELIVKIKEADDDAGISKVLKYQKSLLFFRVGIINNKRELIYDTHTKRLVGSTFFPFQFTTHPEVEQALKESYGYSEKYSYLLEQKLIYLAEKFDFHGKEYIIRLAFPADYIQQLRNRIEFDFLLLASIILILFSALIGIILYHFTTPIRQIIAAIKPYQEGKASFIPEIHLKSYYEDEFSQLSETLNSLSEKIRNQIETLTKEFNEKEALLQALAEGVLTIDKNWNIVYVNSMARKLLKLTHNCTGKPFPQNEHPRCTNLLNKCYLTGKSAQETIDITLEEKRVYITVVTSPLTNGGALLVLQDTTIHYKLIEMRRDFIANASHELKTPITIIRGFAETLHENLDLNKDTIKEITEKIVKNCKRMTKTIKNLLTLADIENLPSFKLYHCDIKELIDNCKAGLSAIYPNTPVKVIYKDNEDYSIDIEPELLEVAIFNLMDNAAKYSQKNPQINVFLKNDKDTLSIIVQDNGIGIPSQDLEHLFQRFYTVNKEQSKRLGGSGLGLSIVKTIVQKHLGKIDLESTLGIGTTFTITIPKDIKERLEAIEKQGHQNKSLWKK